MLALDKPKSPVSGPRNKARAKKGKGKGKAKPEPPEETDPRKLEIIRWVNKKHVMCLCLITVKAY